jgi:hypothetical protein
MADDVIDLLIERETESQASNPHPAAPIVGAVPYCAFAGLGKSFAIEK